MVLLAEVQGGQSMRILLLGSGKVGEGDKEVSCEKVPHRMDSA